MYNEAVLTRILICGVLAVVLCTAVTPVFAATTNLLILPFENQTGDRNVDWLGEGMAELLIEGLDHNRDFYVFDREERLVAFDRIGIPPAVTISRATGLKIAWELGAD